MTVRKLGLKTQFKDGNPGKDYWYSLVNRRPDLAIRKPQNCASNRLNMMTRPVVYRYFDQLEALVNELQLADKPSQIWNCDETGMQFSPDAARVIGQKGARNVVSRCSPSKESVTTLVTINANGKAMPSLCDDIGVQWFTKVFLENCGTARPQLLILDSHHSHEVLEMLELAEKEKIHVPALQPHTTHALQPLDRVVFKPFKTAFKKFCTVFGSQSKQDYK